MKIGTFRQCKDNLFQKIKTNSATIFICRYRLLYVALNSYIKILRQSIPILLLSIAIWQENKINPAKAPGYF